MRNCGNVEAFRRETRVMKHCSTGEISSMNSYRTGTSELPVILQNRVEISLDLWHLERAILRLRFEEVVKVRNLCSLKLAIHTGSK